MVFIWSLSAIALVDGDEKRRFLWLHSHNALCLLVLTNMISYTGSPLSKCHFPGPQQIQQSQYRFFVVKGNFFLLLIIVRLDLQHIGHCKLPQMFSYKDLKHNICIKIYFNLGNFFGMHIGSLYENLCEY